MRRTVPLALGAVLLAAISGCTPAAAPTTLPDGLAVGVYQTRSDIASRTLEIAVTNGTDQLLTVTGVTFASPQFVEPVRWPTRPTTIRPGVTANLPVRLAKPDCDASDPVASVALGWALADGTSGTATVRPDDELDRLPGLRVEDCIGVAVAELARVAVTEPPTLARVKGELLATVRVEITPTGTEGTATVDTSYGTVLLGLADPSTGRPVQERPLGLVIDGQGTPQEIDVTLAPNRCDPHAVAEDKRGTFLPFGITLPNGDAGKLYVPVPDAVRVALYDFVGEACGF